MKEQDVIHIALENLEKNTGFHATWKETAKGPFDGTLTINFNGVKIKFLAEVKGELRQHQTIAIVNRNTGTDPLIFIARKIFPTIKEFLRENNIAYLEANGNIYVNQKPVLIWLDGQKPFTEHREKLNRAFTKTGIQTVFHFLLDEYLINATHREIAKTVKIGLGNVNYILNGLKELGFLVKLNENQYKLIEKQRLLDKWIEAYKEKLQPGLLIGTFRFLEEDDFTNWNKIPLRNMKTWWGGEPAGDMLTNHLRPEELTMYTLETRQELMKNYKLLPDDKGNVRVYKKFWYIDEVDYDLTPPLLIYADLINKNDKRCTETAKIIYDEVIKKEL